MMSDIKNIIFDFGGVLVDWNPRYLYYELVDTKQEADRFLSEICNDEWNMHQDAGRSLKEGTEVLQKKYPEHKDMIQLYYDRWEQMLKDEIPQNSKLIPLLKALNFRLFGLTNWSGETFPIAFRRFPFFKEFEGIVVSGDEKLLKPDKKIFELLLERYGLNPGECLFIDDNIKNTIVAEELGFRTIHYSEGVDLELKLKELNVL
jgi:2-haloacid dehalogenase